MCGRTSHHVRERLLGPAEVEETRDERNEHDEHAEREAAPVRHERRAKDSPAESVYDTHERIEVIPELPLRSGTTELRNPTGLM